MLYFFMLFMLGCGYYTLTYGISLWKHDNNKLGAVATISVAVLGTILPAVVMIIKS